MGTYSDFIRSNAGDTQPSFSTQPQQTNTGGFNQTYSNPSDATLYDEDLINDRDFVAASKVLHEMNESKYAEPLTDEQYAKYGIEAMGWFNYNLPGMTLDAARISGATDSQKRAFLYMMESYDDLGLSWNGTGRFFNGVLKDFTTYIGITTFGLGTAASQGGKAATKAGVKSLLRQSIKGGVIAGIEGGVYATADNINRQVVETSVTGEDIDAGEAATAGLIGFATGGVLGGGVTAGVKKVQAVRAAKKKDVTPKTEALPKLVDELPEMTDVEKLASNTPAGRLRTTMDAVVKKIKKTVPAGKVAAVGDDGVQNMTELVETIAPIKELLTKAAIKNNDEFVDYLLKTDLTDGQSQALEVVTNQTATVLKARVANLIELQKTKVGEEAQKIADEIDKIDEVITPIDQLDAALSTVTGQRLRARQEGINTGDLRGVTVKSLRKQGLSRTDAQKQFESLVKDKVAKFEAKQEIRDLNVKIEAARQRGDIPEYITLKKQKDTKELEFKNAEFKREGMSGIYNAINKPIKVMNEIMISFVFSPSTVIVNIVPSIAKMVYKPLLNNFMKSGLSRASGRALMAEYSSILSMQGTALRSAISAWKYERSMLTGDSSKFIEGYNTIPKNLTVAGRRIPIPVGGVIRFFPRLLLASDAYFEQIHYRAFLVGQATAGAMEDGIAKKMSKTKLDAYVAKKVKEAVDEGYSPEPNAIDVLRDDGISRGLSGKKLENFIKDELDNNQSAFLTATNKGGKDYVQDVLFKRDFSGEGAVSQFAKGYEGFVNRNPVMRLAGQLFFRTPVRVFEEGLRLTAGLNLISPKFMNDLRGKNGELRQIRAQGEALASYAIAGSVFSLYATGNITGSLGQDYKQRRQAENAGELEPYTIRFNDGSTFSYRNLDPFATPIKIIVNALERYETLMYRKEQGERVDDTAYEQAFRMSALALGSITQSIRDANLASGVDAIIKAFEDASDPESSDQIIKVIGQKVQTFVPNTLYKIQMLDNPVLGDPATLEQFIRQRVNPDDPLVPKQYTALGNPRRLSNPMQNLIYFDRITNEERKRGMSESELKVEQFLYRLAQVGDTHFTAPYENKYLPGYDLRKEKTRDGQESLYDRWMKYTREAGVVERVGSLMNLPMGTASDVGFAEREVKRTLNLVREQAFIRLMKEQGMLDIYREAVRRSELNKSGQNYVPNIMFQGNN